MAKKILQCLECDCDLQKSEAQFVDEETFGFLTQLPAGISIGTYCNMCFESQVRFALNEYSGKMERAKDVNIFYSSQSKESRFVRRTEKPVQVKDCLDREEAILRLAFLAVEANLNALVDVDLSSFKVHHGNWKSARWNGQAIPAHIDEVALKRRFVRAPS